MQYPRKWEDVEQPERLGWGTQRLKVHGGWLVRTWYQVKGQTHSNVHYFKDPNFEWVIE